MFVRTDKIKPFESKIWLSSPTMHGDELKYMTEAFESGWMSTVGENIGKLEQLVSQKIGCKYAVALASGTAALHMCVRLAGIKRGDKVFCSDMTFAATANPIAYEGGELIFIDSETDTWNMDPVALEKAFRNHPDAKAVMIANLYGVPGKMDELVDIAHRHGAVVIEDAAESFGATYKGVQTGTFGDYCAISFNGNKIITGSSGGMFLTNNKDDADTVRKWSTQSRDMAPWYQHTEVGYNYRMSNVIAGVVRGQMPYLEEHISQKRMIFERYKEGLKDLPVSMNPYEECSVPNYWISCLLINEDAMCEQVRDDHCAKFKSEHGKSCPTEILETLNKLNAEGRPIWKPMHLQPIFKKSSFFKVGSDIGADIFNRGLCLPSDNKIKEEQQDRIIETIRACFE